MYVEEIRYFGTTVGQAVMIGRISPENVKFKENFTDLSPYFIKPYFVEHASNQG